MRLIDIQNKKLWFVFWANCVSFRSLQFCFKTSLKLHLSVSQLCKCSQQWFDQTHKVLCCPWSHAWPQLIGKEFSLHLADPFVLIETSGDTWTTFWNHLLMFHTKNKWLRNNSIYFVLVLVNLTDELSASIFFSFKGNRRTRRRKLKGTKVQNLYKVAEF